MKTRLVVGGAVAAVALGAAGVGVAVAGSGGSTAAAGGGYGYGSSAATSAPAAPSAATVTSRATDLGPTLVDGAGRTLYLFRSDSSTTSTCSGSCASVWPPASARASTPLATGGARRDLLGTLRRTDGTTQLTYAGHPLYYYAGDAKPGDTTGQGLDQFGAPWYALTPGGGTIDTN